MGCSSSHASHIKVQRNYDDVRFTGEKNDEEGRGVPDGQEKYVDVRECTDYISFYNNQIMK